MWFLKYYADKFYINRNFPYRKSNNNELINYTALYNIKHDLVKFHGFVVYDTTFR